MWFVTCAVLHNRPSRHIATRFLWLTALFVGIALLRNWRFCGGWSTSTNLSKMVKLVTVEPKLSFRWTLMLLQVWSTTQTTVCATIFPILRLWTGYAIWSWNLGHHQTTGIKDWGERDEDAEVDVWSDKKIQNQERTHPRNDESSAGV